jgi:hypothetical protein
MSEPFWEEEGHDQVAEDEDAQDQPDDQFRAHRRSTPLMIRKVTPKNAIVMAT